MRVAQLRRFVVGFHHLEFDGVECICGITLRLRRHTQQEIANGSLAHLPDELRHHRQPTGNRDCAFVRLFDTGNEAQQRGLACTIRADQSGNDAFTNPERHVVEQRSTIGQRVRNPLHINMSHYSSSDWSRVARVNSWRASRSSSAG